MTESDRTPDIAERPAVSLMHGEFEFVQPLLRSLEAFVSSGADEEFHRVQIADFVRSHPRPFDRAHLDAHLTGSALVIDSVGERVLLGFHRKLGRWLQLGGHGEPGETCAEAVAFREAEEESGIEGLRPHPTAPRPFDVDIHPIPARFDVPAHFHLDVRYALLAPPGAQPVRREEEHLQMQWWSWAEADGLDLEFSLRRMLKKARAWV